MIARGRRIPEKSKRAVWERCVGRCEAKLLGCNGRFEQIHHMKSKARMGTNDPINLLAVCSPCHHKITVNAPGTERFRTHAWQKEGIGEDGGKIHE